MEKLKWKMSKPAQTTRKGKSLLLKMGQMMMTL
jgi:hypothetical protein